MPPDPVASLPRMDDFLTDACRAGPGAAVRDLHEAWAGTCEDGIAACGLFGPGCAPPQAGEARVSGSDRGA